jgi:predicted RND superfamily exporter protein
MIMLRLARLMTNRTVAWVTVVTVLAIAGASTYLAMQVQQDDDLLAFLPADNPDVKHFHELNKRFGGIDVALVGIDAGRSQSVFETDFLRRLKRATDELSDTSGLDGVVTLDNVTDFVADRKRGGIITGPLVGAIPSGAKAMKVLRDKVMARDHVVGTFVSRDGQSTLLYCFLAHGANPRRVAAAIRGVVDKHFPKHARYWGGNPFISSYIFDTTQRDMRRLTPWAVLAMVIVMMIAFRDLLGTCLALLSTSFGIVIAIGLMTLAGEPINLVLSSMPVILFAVGSAYGIHILAHYYVWVRRRAAEDPDEDDGDRRAAAVSATLRSTGPTVLAAGLTTVVSLLSFLAMDLRPMRVFGLFTAIGVLTTLILSLTFIPAVARLVKLRGRSGGDGPGPLVSNLLQPLVRWVQRRRKLAVLVLLAVAVGAGVAVLRVENRIDATNLFAPGSPPDAADRFLARSFGGSQFLQLHLKGDLDDPLLLRELTYLGDQLRFFPHVSSVVHIGSVVSRVNEAMEGQRRIPNSRAKIKMLQAFASGEAAVKQLVADKRRQALVQVKLGSSNAETLERLLTRIERWIGHGSTRRYRVAKVSKDPAAKRRQLQMVLARLRHGLAAEGLQINAEQLSKLRRGLEGPAPKLDRKPVIARLKRFLRSDECTAELPAKLDDGADPAQALAVALVALGAPPPRQGRVEDPKQGKGHDGPSPWETKLTTTIATTLGKAKDSELVEDVLLSVMTPLSELFAGEAATQRASQLLTSGGVALPADAGVAKRARAAVAAALLDLSVERILMPLPAGSHAVASGTKAKAGLGVATLAARVNGLPTIHRALSKSALHNQVSSLATALIPVIVIMIVLFRSFFAGFLVATPTVLTLLVIYGGMGLLGVRLDIGTSMLACIILGAGVDYGVHLVAAWNDPGHHREVAAQNAVRSTGPAIWTNALTVSVGFFVLTMGQARPLQNVGGLTALAMLAAALATFLAIPVLARRPSYGRSLDLGASLATHHGVSETGASNRRADRDVQADDAMTRPTSASGRKP